MERLEGLEGAIALLHYIEEDNNMDTNYLLTLIERNSVHLATLNDEMGGVQRDVAVLTAQVHEILWFTRVVVVAVVGLVLERFFKAFGNVRNNNKK